MSRDHQQDGLAVISLSFDSPDKQDAVVEFLRKQKATFDNLIAKSTGDADPLRQFGAPGTIPFYQLFDRLGVLRYQFSPNPQGLKNGEVMENIDRRVKELLAE